MTNKHHIKLNNKVYDAVTGALVNSEEQSIASTNTEKSELKRHSKKSGRSLVSELKQPAKSHTHTNTHSRHRTRKPGNIDHSNLHKKQTKSKILMRKTVRKPQKIKAKSAPTPTPIQKQVSHAEATRSKNLLRQKKAHNIQKHQMVRKFNQHSKQAIDGISTQVKPLPMAKAPESDNKPAEKTVQTTHEQSRPLARIDSFVNPNKTTIKTATPKNSISNYLQAIEKADSHLEPQAKLPKKEPKLSRKLRFSPSLTNAILAVSLLLIVGSLIAYSQAPNIAMRIASMRSGIEAQLPRYQPTGYSVNGAIKYQPGKVNMVYASSTDQSSYEISQTASQWNSEALLENYILANDKDYQAFQSRGRTIYIYSGSNATWVDNGIWYNIESNQALSNDQLLRIAGSL